jgi:hypothetical protein
MVFRAPDTSLAEINVSRFLRGTHCPDSGLLDVYGIASKQEDYSTAKYISGTQGRVDKNFRHEAIRNLVTPRMTGRGQRSSGTGARGGM